MVHAKHTMGWEIILDAPNELLGDVGQVEACIGVFGQCVNLDARYVRYVHGLHRMYHRLINYFGHF
jgi:hypothetical protein